jgi:DNA segregation ATPase FtsK/SpoIIIE-like protein
MNIFFLDKNRVMRCIGIILYGVIIIFVMISLVSYNPTDSSWLYISTEPGAISNYGGFLGAQLAAFLFYMLGGASFLLLIPLLTLGWIVFIKKTIKNSWERLCASFYIVSVGAALLATYYIDCAASPYPGGLLGLRFAQLLVHYFDPIGRMLFLYGSLCASLIMLFRWSFMFMVQHGIYAMAQLYLLMKKYRVVSKTAYALGMCAHAIFVRFPIMVTQFIISLLNGTAFHEAGLIHPEYEYDFTQNEQNQKLIEEFDDIADVHQQQVDIIYVNYLVMTLQKHDVAGVLKADIAPVTLLLPKMFPPKKHIHSKKTDASILAHKIETTSFAKGGVYPELVEGKDRQTSTSTLIKQAPHYALPHMDIFIAEKHSQDDHNIEKELQERAQVLQDKLKRFGVNGEVVAIKRGPVVTVFEYQPDIDTKLSKIIVLEDDLAMALQAMSIRIIAPIPGRSVVGFEVSNTTRHDVLFSQITRSAAYTQFSGSLPLVLGKDTIGDAVVVDLARMPHLLIAGSTGSGKSVALNAVLISLLCKLSPDDLKLILIDPKRLEFAAFTDIPHLLFPIVTSPVYAAPVLRWVVQEMEDRYEKMAQCGARNISDYNSRIIASENSKALPYIVVVIDELADLMITAGRDIEDLITRITQMARAAGIHMIVATQRPSVDVITGLIKANFPSRISFRVASRIDSRTILDTMGADRLLGRGDMLFLDASTSQLKRVHGAYVSDKEIEQVADHIRQQRKVEYLDMQQVTGLQGQDGATIDDVLYKDVREFLDEIDEVSISLLQRKFRIGYNRSARIIEMLEAQGLIMPQDGGKTRKVIR